MNKKISTMLASFLLMTGATSGYVNAQGNAEDVNLLTASGYYYIATEDGRSYLSATNFENLYDGNSYARLISVDKAVVEDGDDSNDDAFLFKISASKLPGVNAKGTYFTLTNKKSGKVYFVNTSPVTFPTNSDVESVVKKYFGDLTGVEIDTQGKAIVKADGSSNFTLVPYTKVNQETEGGGTSGYNSYGLQVNMSVSGKLSIVDPDFSSLSKFVFKSVEQYIISAEELNHNLRTGFSFDVDGVADVNNPFSQKLKAFTVTTPIDLKDLGEGYEIPTGTYLAVSYPNELAGRDKNSISDADLFRQCTFIALSPSDNAINSDANTRKAGGNFTLTTVEGSAFNFYTLEAGDPGYELDKAPRESQISIYNANLTVKTDKNHEDTYLIEADKFYFNETSSSPKQKYLPVQIGIANVGGQKMLATKASDDHFVYTFVDEPVVKPLSLLNENGAAIYNIGIGNDFLGVADLYESSTANPDYQLVTVGTGLINLDYPQAQFIIKKVDTDKQLITFENRETDVEFTCRLFTTGTENTYYIADVEAGKDQYKALNARRNGAWEEAVYFTKLEDRTIKLTPANVDQLAGFVNHESAEDFVNIKFALNDFSEDKLFAEVDYSGSTWVVKEATADQGNAALWSLIKTSEKPVYHFNDYMYKKDGVATPKAAGDTVAYYTYYLRLVDAQVDLDDNYYLNITASNTLNVSKTTNFTDAYKFMIKQNMDGSVAIMPYKKVTNNPLKVDNKFIACEWDNSNEVYKVELQNTPYVITRLTHDTPEDLQYNFNLIKSYLQPEQLGISLEPKEQDLAFKNSRGGYLSPDDENNAAVIIKSEADTDVMLHLFPADVDAALPLFYITKDQSKFMYFAKDSADHYINNPAYMFDENKPKVIFKEASLINEDRISTTVAGQTKNVEANPKNDGTLGGLNNFRFQIFKWNEADEEYVIRCKRSAQYIQNINGLLTLTDNRDEALKLVVEEQVITSNDAISVEEGVRVIAGEGQIAVQGAAGKQVMITNILGKTLVVKVLSSDNEMIAVPAGAVIVKVADETVKAMVK